MGIQNYDPNQTVTLRVVEVYWITSVIVMAFGTFHLLQASWRLYQLWPKVHPITIAAAPVLIAHACTLLNFIPFHVYNLATGIIPLNGYCYLSAFWSIAHVFALGGQYPYIAYATYRTLVEPDSEFYASHVRNTLLWTAGCWILGFILSAVFAANGDLGLFHGLYCCLTDPSRTYILVIYFSTLAVFGAGMAYQYRKTYKALRSHDSIVKKIASVSFETETSTAVFRQGLWMVSSFYVCWGWVGVNSIVEAAQTPYSIWLDIVAANIIKAQVPLDCWSLSNSLERQLARRRKKDYDMPASGEQAAGAATPAGVATPLSPNKESEAEQTTPGLDLNGGAGTNRRSTGSLAGASYTPPNGTSTPRSVMGAGAARRKSVSNIPVGGGGNRVAPAPIPIPSPPLPLPLPGESSDGSPLSTPISPPSASRVVQPDEFPSPRSRSRRQSGAEPLGPIRAPSKRSKRSIMHGSGSMAATAPGGSGVSDAGDTAITIPSDPIPTTTTTTTTAVAMTTLTSQV